MAEIINEIRSTLYITQKLSEKSCGALATLSGICHIPRLKNSLIEYIEDKCKDKKYRNTLLSCKNNFGYRRHWWNIFIKCIYEHNGYDPILPAVFLNRCFPNVYTVYSCTLGQILNLDMRIQEYIIRNNAVIVSSRRKLSSTSHWFNILDIFDLDENSIFYKYYDTVGMMTNMSQNENMISMSWFGKYIKSKDYYSILAKEDLDILSQVNIITDIKMEEFFDNLKFSKNWDLVTYERDIDILEF
jgi:hypothetical protein